MIVSSSRLAGAPAVAARQALLRRLGSVALAGLVATLASPLACAQAGVPLRESAPPAEQVAPTVAPLVTRPAVASGDDAGDERKVDIAAFRVAGGETLPAAEVAALLAAFPPGRYGASGLQRAAAALAALSLRHALLARVAVEPLGTDATVTLRLMPLRLNRLTVDREQAPRTAPGIAERYFGERLVAGERLPIADVERAVAILNRLPGIAAAAALDPGPTPDSVDLSVRLRDRSLASGGLDLDNYGLRETGETRLTGRVQLDNLLGCGDQTMLRLRRSDTAESSRASFSHPLGDDGLRLGVEARRIDYTADRLGTAIGLRGALTAWRAFALWPALLVPGRTVHIGVAYTDGEERDETEIAAITDRRIEHWSLAVNARFGDDSTHTQLAAQLDTGRADLGADPALLAADAVSTRIHGRFARLQWRLAHERRLAGGAVLALRARGQQSSRNLDATLQFALGGPDGVRAYPIAEGLGDAGWLASAEWRTALAPSLTGALFADAGSIVRARHPWADQRNRDVLAGAGAGVEARLSADFGLKAEFAHQLGHNPQRDGEGRDSDGRRRRWRFWLALTRAF